MKTAITPSDNPTTVTVIPAANDRVLLTLESRGWTLIDAYLTSDEVAAVLSGLTAHALGTIAEFKAGI